jgi:hypothetical protein
LLYTRVMHAPKWPPRSKLCDPTAAESHEIGCHAPRLSSVPMSRDTVRGIWSKSEI